MSATSKIDVILVNKLNHTIALQKGEFALVKGRLPIRDICNQWGIKNVVWADVSHAKLWLGWFTLFQADIEIGETPDGLSDIAFNNLKLVKIIADRK